MWNCPPLPLPRGELCRMKTKVVIKPQTEYSLAETEANIREIFDELDIPNKLKGKNKVLLKPNLLGGFHPDRAVTTHPIVLEAVIKILKEERKEVIVGDSPGGTMPVLKVWKETGIFDVCARNEVRLIDFGKEAILPIRSDITDFYINETVMRCDAIINLAKLKTHSLMLYTGAVKNIYGVIPGLYKTELHKHFPNPKDFSLVLSELYKIVKPQIVLNIIDGIIGMDGEGPSAGKPYPYNVLIASEKASAADSIATRMMGFNTNNINYIKQALIIDEITESDIIIEDKWQAHRFNDLNIKSVIHRNRVMERLPSFMKKIIQAILSYYPDFLPNCNLCLICVKACPVDALKELNDKIILNKKTCIKCLCCHEMCPSSAIFLKKGIFAKMIFR